MTTRLLTLITVAGLAMACNTEPTGLGTVSPVGGGDPGFQPATAIGVTPTSPVAGLPVTFNSSALAGGDRSWDFGDGTADTGMVVVHTFADPGEYRVTLTIDAGGAIDQHVVRVTVEDAGRGPEFLRAAGFGKRGRAWF